MATRPVFVAKDSYPFCEVKETEFKFYSGFADSQKKKCIMELHRSFTAGINKKVLEVSTKSTEEIGVRLSAFNLPIRLEGAEISLECAFQGSKKFANGGPYTELYHVSSREAKKDERIRNSGELTGFELMGKAFSREPKDYFYNWIYIKALCEKPEYLREVAEYDAFTDIEFNPQKSLNCQAKAAAIAVGLYRAGVLEACMKDENAFLKTVYGIEDTGTYEQMSLF